MQKRSTSSEVKGKIQSHIWECIHVDDETLNQGEILVEVLMSFKRWWSDHKEIHNQGEAFGQYLQCLPSELSVEYYYSDMGDLLEKWLGASENQYSNKEIATRYYWLIYREFNTLCKKYKVDFT